MFLQLSLSIHIKGPCCILWFSKLSSIVAIVQEKIPFCKWLAILYGCHIMLRSCHFLGFCMIETAHFYENIWSSHLEYSCIDSLNHVLILVNHLNFTTYQRYKNSPFIVLDTLLRIWFYSLPSISSFKQETTKDDTKDKISWDNWQTNKKKIHTVFEDFKILSHKKRKFFSAYVYLYLLKRGGGGKVTKYTTWALRWPVITKSSCAHHLNHNFFIAGVLIFKTLTRKHATI